MEREQKQLTVAEIKKMDMVSYLSSIGFEAAKIKGNNYWYLSPLRHEKTASFKINRKLNCWFDHGIGKGGNLIDFGTSFFNCSVKELLQKFTDSFSFHQPVFHVPTAAVPDPVISILNDFCISSYGLVKYLAQRKIDAAAADQFCREVRFQLRDKTYYAIGFKNDAGGYEIRNAFLKLSSTPKAPATIKNGSSILCVFEGFFDFLSYIMWSKNSVAQCPDFLVLNSLAFFETCFPFMEQYEKVKLYLDRDISGQNCSREAVQKNKCFTDESVLYKGFKDFNDWWVNNYG